MPVEVMYYSRFAFDEGLPSAFTVTITAIRGSGNVNASVPLDI
jgi:hypothetical protein